MAQQAKQKKLKALYELSMNNGGLPEFRKNFEQSIGLVTDDAGKQSFSKDNRDVEYKEFHIGGVMDALIGPRWRTTFEQYYQRASNARFEGLGGIVMSGELPYVSAAIDVIAGLANARALERPASPDFIWDSFCTPVEIPGEGGFDIIVRTDGNQPSKDLSDGEPIPTVTLKGSRIHRNRTLNQGLRTKINKYTILDDLTGTLYGAVEENANQVLNERERKVADCVMGVAKTKGAANTFALTVASGAGIGSDLLAIPVQQDGETFFPYQKGVAGAAGANAGAVVMSDQTKKYLRNYANCNFTDTFGLTDYNCFVRALNILTQNKDPFSGLPYPINLSGMTILVSAASEIQLKTMIQAETLWQIANSGLSTSGGTNMVSQFNYAKELGLNIKTSQVWMNRLLDVGVTTLSAAGAYAHLAFNATSGYSTAASINSALFMGHYKDAVRYAQRQPYTVQQVPIGPDEYAEETVLIQDVRERGQAYWVNPRIVWRAWA